MIYGNEKLRQKIKEILDKIWKGGTIPKEWKEGIITPIYKKGDKKKAETYREITLMDSGYKIYT